MAHDAVAFEFAGDLGIACDFRPDLFIVIGQRNEFERKTHRVGIAPDHPSERLFSERHVVVGCASNAVLTSPLAIEDFDACGHASVRIQGKTTFIEAALQAAGDHRRIEIIAPSFLKAPWLLRNTNRLGLMHERLACLLGGPLGLAIVECPVPLPMMNEMMQHHAARANDDALSWLRERLIAEANGTSFAKAGGMPARHRRDHAPGAAPDHARARA